MAELVRTVLTASQRKFIDPSLTGGCLWRQLEMHVVELVLFLYENFASRCSAALNDNAETPDPALRRLHLPHTAWLDVFRTPTKEAKPGPCGKRSSSYLGRDLTHLGRLALFPQQWNSANHQALKSTLLSYET